MTNEPPPPDLLDERGRLRRLVLSFVIACVVATVAYWFADGVTTAHPSRRGMGSFILFVTGGSFAVTFASSLAIQNAIEKRRYRKSLSLPSATLRR
jgi:hypothetical protein